MNFINTVHTIFSVLAVITGGVVLLQPKGTRLHIRVGYAYVVSMFFCLFTSFFIFDLFGSFGAYHVLSIVSLVTIGLGMYFAIFGRNSKGWAIQHYMWMSYSFVGLIMAGGSHLFGVFRGLPNWLEIILYWVLPYAVGSWLIFRNRRKILSSVKDRTGMDFMVR